MTEDSLSLRALIEPDATGESVIEGQGEPAGTPDRIQATSRRLIRDGRPYLPIMGEYHYARARPEDWAEELAAMRAGGITAVSTYVLWILHEEHRGRIRWDGPRDLRRFARLCAEAGLDLVPRIGPWCHGEARYGGFPDWVVREFGERTRTDDPGYLAAVQGFWAELADQLTGLCHRDGGPVIAIQLENELVDRPDHLVTLRRLAERLGMAPALWTATGWDGARLPLDRVLALYGGYADAFWEDASVGWPAVCAPNFQFTTVRDPGIAGPVSAPEIAPGTEQPFATCEIGGGLPVAYHRRPLVQPAEVAAMALTKLGCGSVWQGYYLYHGGQQARLEDGWSQESQATGYPNDLPQVDYDFAAPIGAQGELRDHFHLLRQQHLFLATWGERLASMPTSLPEPETDLPEEVAGLRWAVRADDRSGFLFFNNHQPAAAPLPELGPLRFEVELGEKSIMIPTGPIVVPSGGYGVLPLNLELTTATTISSGTVQPLTRIGLDHEPGLTVLAALPGIPAEVVIAGAVSAEVRRGDATVERRPGHEFVIRIDQFPARVRLNGDGPAELLIIDPATARRCWTLELDGAERLLITDAEPLPAAGSSTLVRCAGPARLEVYPPLTRPPQSVTGGRCELRDVGDHTELLLQPDGDAAAPSVTVIPIRPARPELLPPITTGSNGRILVPREEAWHAAARWRFRIDPQTLTGLHRAVLLIDWIGDIARLLVDGELVLDQFYAGRPFAYALRAPAAELEFQVLPRRPGAPIHLDPRVRELIKDRPAATLDTARIQPMYAVGLWF